MRWIGAMSLILLAYGQDPKFSSTTNLVVVNVAVRDRSGKPITGLKASDFDILEDDKAQKIAFFDEEKLSSEPLPAVSNAPSAAAEGGIEPPAGRRFQDKRLIGLFFDFSSMAPPEQLRAQQAAIDFLNKNMTASDVVSIMTFSTQFKTVQDFTGDRSSLIETLRRFRIGEGAELVADAPTGDTGDDDSGTGLFAADETEFNIFNTDRKLTALETAARTLAQFPEKKALIYFASGVSQTGTENQAQLRATINAAVRANVSFYPVDARGLVAAVPAGDATTTGSKGTGLFSGSAQTQARSKFNDSQETLFTLAADTGGKALLDSNDLSAGIRQAQRDLDSYYVIGYYSSNPQQDGKYRRIKVRLANAQLQAKLDFRPGYYAAKDWTRFTASDKERQLDEALQAGDPVNDLPLAIEIDYFRLARDKYFVPISVKIPGSAVGLGGKGDKRATELDFIGQVRDKSGKLVSAVRDGITVKMSEAGAAQLAQRYLQYDTGMALAPGPYTLRFLARENRTGKMGTFETKFTVPDLNADSKWSRLSSVVWAGQREPVSAAVGSAGTDRKLLANHPLVHDGEKLIPSVTRVFKRNQPVWLYFEVYDAQTDAETKAPAVAANLAVFEGSRKAWESSPVRATSSVAHRGNTVAFQMQLPAARLKPGQYTAQLNVVDELGRKFAFSRSALLIVP